jgi:hypothetical protein
VTHPRALVLAAAAAALLAACATPSSTGPMSFFITSTGQRQGRRPRAGSPVPTRSASVWPAAAGAGRKTWRAYLSTPPTFPSGSTPAVAAVHARDRIGTGPWFNAKGQLIARDLTTCTTATTFEGDRARRARQRGQRAAATRRTSTTS